MPGTAVHVPLPPDESPGPLPRHALQDGDDALDELGLIRRGRLGARGKLRRIVDHVLLVVRIRQREGGGSLGEEHGALVAGGDIVQESLQTSRTPVPHRVVREPGDVPANAPGCEPVEEPADRRGIRRREVEHDERPRRRRADRRGVRCDEGGGAIETGARPTVRPEESIVDLVADLDDSRRDAGGEQRFADGAGVRGDRLRQRIEGGITPRRGLHLLAGVAGVGVVQVDHHVEPEVAGAPGHRHDVLDAVRAVRGIDPDAQAHRVHAMIAQDRERVAGAAERVAVDRALRLGAGQARDVDAAQAQG